MKRNVYVGVLFDSVIDDFLHQYEKNRLSGGYERIVILSDECPTGNEDSTG